ncbi:putative membrane protein [Sorangium cellulosum So ce56]|uniref:Membrane protein n=1 Tax=Sorangium cellulosum (strain So ce56) TaxID=448385 RepID=A9EQJ0_SORC5|nr:AEC family transporter [Sorangium cellulosum]CAN94146.1 putative membrane protein [Sorangium cellulosum So ce56]
MPSGDLISQLLALFAVLGVGVLLRALGRAGQADAAVLHRLVIDVTTPALIVTVLRRSGIGHGAWGAVAASTVALFACALAGVAVARALGLPRAAQGAAGLVGSFSNTGFLGVPVVLALYGDAGGAAGTAILVDSIVTAFLLWTFGVALAARMGGGGGGDGRGLLAVLLHPNVLSIAVGLTLHAAPIPLPVWLERALGALGSATPTLVFLALGLSLDLGSLRGRVRPLAAVAAVKLLLSPAVALGVAVALGLKRPSSEVAVLQSAMPTSMVSVIVAARYGCDGQFAAAAAVVTTLGALATLPIVVEALRRIVP